MSDERQFADGRGFAPPLHIAAAVGEEFGRLSPLAVLPNPPLNAKVVSRPS
jgi:hypothetical protein